MKKFQEFSHLNGAEYLAVKKVSIHREIIAMLSASQGDALRENAAYPNNSLLEIFNIKLAEVALRRGWRRMCAGFEKERIALHFLTSPLIEPPAFKESLGNWLWGYATGSIDVGVGIVPTNIARRHPRNEPGIERPIDNFNEIVKEIKQLGRNLPLVPFLLIATPLQVLKTRLKE